MKTWTAAFADVNGIRLHYTRTGGDHPPLVLLHGLMTNGLCWTPLARRLESAYDVILPDARGHGMSSAPARRYRYEDHAGDIAGLIEALQLPAPVLLGHSMGGMTAAVIASRYRHLVRGVILADPTFLSPDVQEEVWNSDVAETHQKALACSLEALIVEGRKRHPFRSLETITLFAQARLQTNMAAFEVLRPPNPPYREVMQGVTVPALLLYGDRGVVTAPVAAELQRLNERLQTVCIPEAGHPLHLDQPECFTLAVQTFLEALALSG